MTQIKTQQIIEEQRIKSEASAFFYKIQEALPKSAEMASVGTEKIYRAFYPAFIEYRKYKHQSDIEEFKELLIDADSLLSYLHHRGFINYSKEKCPTKEEVMNLVGRLRKQSDLIQSLDKEEVFEKPPLLKCNCNGIQVHKPDCEIFNNPAIECK